MTKLGFVRGVSAAAAMTVAQGALAQGAAAGPSFAISAAGWWSMLGLGVGVAVAVWAFRKVT